MTRHLLLIFLAVGLLACGSQTEKPAEQAASASEQPTSIAPEALISCEGIGQLSFRSNFRQLTEQFGASVSDLEEGMDGDFCTVKLGTDATITVTFDYEGETGEKILLLSTDSPKFKTALGIYPGMKLSEAAALVGESVSVYFNSEIGVAYIQVSNDDCGIGYLANKADLSSYEQVSQAAGESDGFVLSGNPAIAELDLYIAYIELMNKY